MTEFLKVGMYFDNVTELNVKRVSVDGAIGEVLVTDHIGRLSTDLK